MKFLSFLMILVLLISCDFSNRNPASSGDMLRAPSSNNDIGNAEKLNRDLDKIIKAGGWSYSYVKKISKEVCDTLKFSGHEFGKVVEKYRRRNFDIFENFQLINCVESDEAFKEAWDTGNKIEIGELLPYYLNLVQFAMGNQVSVSFTTMIFNGAPREIQLRTVKWVESYIKEHGFKHYEKYLKAMKKSLKRNAQ
ncbi:MAG: hypothetical protein DRQ88_11705 [Epsilonproteobacteria bacterium]|nr:MAG: hypothetical protein DRQ88_11705 [Campylobacterota bacterium]